MELRYVLKFAIGIAAGATALVGAANAAPLAPVNPARLAAPQVEAVMPALVSQAEIDHLKPTEVRWGRGWHRHGGWHRHWHRRWR